MCVWGALVGAFAGRVKSSREFVALLIGGFVCGYTTSNLGDLAAIPAILAGAAFLWATAERKGTPL